MHNYCHDYGVLVGVKHHGVAKDFQPTRICGDAAAVDSRLGLSSSSTVFHSILNFLKLSLPAMTLLHHLTTTTTDNFHHGNKYCLPGPTLWFLT